MHTNHVICERECFNHGKKRSLNRESEDRQKTNEENESFALRMRVEQKKQNAYIFFIKNIYISLQSSLPKQMLLSEKLKKKIALTQTENENLYCNTFETRFLATFHLALGI